MTDAGIEEPHAKAIAGVVRDGRAGLAAGRDIHRLEDRMATKTDVADLKAEVARIDAKLDAHISSTRWVFGLLVALQVMMAARLFGVL